MSRPEQATPAQKRVLDAAKVVFARYGFRKASMADIAREAGVSRPAVYQWFPGKTALFQALARTIAADALNAADAAWPDGVALAVGLPAAILAKDLPLYRLLHASPHGAELLAVDEALTAAVATDLEAAFAALLAAKALRCSGCGALDLAAFDGAAGFGLTVAGLASGLKATTVDEEGYVDGVRRLCRLVTAAATPCGARSTTQDWNGTSPGQ